MLRGKSFSVKGVSDNIGIPLHTHTHEQHTHAHALSLTELIVEGQCHSKFFLLEKVTGPGKGGVGTLQTAEKWSESITHCQKQKVILGEQIAQHFSLSRAFPCFFADLYVFT